MLYRVSYEIDVDADSPLEAALRAESIMLNSDGLSFRPVLTVTSDESTATIDLDKEGCNDENE